MQLSQKVKTVPSQKLSQNNVADLVAKNLKDNMCFDPTSESFYKRKH